MIKGCYVRHIFFALSILFVLDGGKQSGNTVAPVTERTLSVSNVQDSILYTFAVSKATFCIHDTFGAALILYNQSISTDTLIL
jgi:hypothetical protein